MPISFQKRNFEWDANLSAKNGKPAITGTKHVFVSKKIPIVLLKDVEGVGNTGEIKFVKRGQARHWLIPQKLAVFGTIWQNIDEFADPKVIQGAKVIHSSEGQQRLLPFDWINTIVIEFVRNVSNDGKSISKITPLEILKHLSDNEQLDLLPSELTLPDGGVSSIGEFEIQARIVFKGWIGNYKMKVIVKSMQAEQEAERQKLLLQEALEKKKVYALKQKSDFKLSDYQSTESDDETDEEQVDLSDDE